MNIVITMAGLGSRFRKAGYNIPKYMIEAKGQTLFEWSLESLTGFEDDNTYYFVVRKEDDALRFISDVCKNRGILKFKIIEIECLTKGQAETVMLAEPFWDSLKPLLIYNIDTYIEAGEMNSSQIKGDGFIPCFQGEGDHWSFVRLDKEGSVTEIKEKKRISNFCTVGAYYFKTANLFKELYTQLYLTNKYLEAGEQYVAPMYDLLLKKKGQIYIADIPVNKVHVLGTPEELALFKDSL